MLKQSKANQLFLQYIFKTKANFLIIFSLFTSILNAQNLPYQDTNLSFEERTEDLLSRLTLEEKIGLMMDSSNPIERLGIKKYNWWNESLHGVARAGKATVFPQPIAMAATFDQDLIFRVFNAISDEARAKNNLFIKQDSYERYQGLTMWTPTINIFRDPRWGRGIETYGEDPFLTSILGVAAVNGLQNNNANSKYDKVHACAKHFAVHSGPEWNRHSFNAKNIKKRDLYETYLPAFEALVKEADVQEVMCAYNRLEDEPCCGNDQLLTQILRKNWGFEGIVVSDCGAIADFYKKNAHEIYPDATTASAKAVLSGTDLECGSSYKSLIQAVNNQQIKESDIDISVKRLLLARFKLGEMDNQKNVEWSQINPSIIASNSHAEIALEVARKSITLLLNKSNILPLKKDGLTVAVMGPNANDSIMQWGNYNGTPSRTTTILDGIKNNIGQNSKVIYEQAVGLVEDYVFESAFDKNNLNIYAKYWNNLDKKGNSVAEEIISNSFSKSTSFDKPFHTNVDMKNFSAQYLTTFSPNETKDASLQFYVNGKLEVKINDSVVISTKTGHGAKKVNYKFLAEKRKKYKIELDYAYNNGDALLNFDIGYLNKVNINKSLEKVKNADVIIFVGGISPSLEGEEMGVNLPGFKKGDRTDIELPSIQKEMLQSLATLNKPIIYINCSGSAIGLEEISKLSTAIIQAWYPGQEGGNAVTDVLFGDFNPTGRLPITFYKNVDQLPDFENYDMEGRTYRYFRDEPLFAFGYGLSFSNFKYGEIRSEHKKIKKGESISFTIPIKNESNRNGEEVVQLYIKRLDDKNGPIKTLRAVKNISIPSGKTENVKFTLNEKDLKTWNEDLNTMDVQSGKYLIQIGKSSRENDLKSINIELY